MSKDENLISTDVKLKICNKCKEAKPFSDFSKDSATKDKLRYYCRNCHRNLNKSYYNSKEGLISKIYGSQRQHSKHRNHPIPGYTKQELATWIYSQPKFESLYQGWVEAGYDKNKVPSCDRLDDYKPYTIDNLQLMTWAENNEKGRADIKNGINKKKCRAVNQYTLFGIFVSTYYSAKQAAIETGFSRRGIGACCLGRYKTSGGFKWEFTEENENA